MGSIIATDAPIFLSFSSLFISIESKKIFKYDKKTVPTHPDFGRFGSAKRHFQVAKQTVLPLSQCLLKCLAVPNLRKNILFVEPGRVSSYKKLNTSFLKKGKERGSDPDSAARLILSHLANICLWNFATAHPDFHRTQRSEGNAIKLSIFSSEVESSLPPKMSHFMGLWD